MAATESKAPVAKSDPGPDSAQSTPKGSPGALYEPEIEASLLGGLLFRPELLVDIDDQLADTDFHDRRHQKIYQAISQLYKDGRDIDVLVVANQLKRKKQLTAVGGQDYLAGLIADILTTETVKEYAQIVVGAARRRNLIEVGRQITGLGQDQQKSVATIFEEAEQKLFQVSQQQVQSTAFKLDQLLSDKFDRLDKLKSLGGKTRGVATDIIELDRILSGFHNSDLFVLAARPAMGKTSFALNLAYNIARRQQPVLFFSLEMSQDQLLDRLLALASGIDAWKIRNANLTDKDFTELNQALSRLSETELFIDDAVGLNISQLRTKIRRQHHRQKLSLVVIDYLQLMSGLKPGLTESNRVYEIGEISRGLKIIARELDIPIMVLSQLNRLVESRDNKRPQLSDLRDSGAIEQDADVVAFLYRDDYYNPETTKKPGIVDVIIGKHRNGPTETVEVYFNRQRQRYLDVDRRQSGQ